MWRWNAFLFEDVLNIFHFLLWGLLLKLKKKKDKKKILYEV